MIKRSTILLLLMLVVGCGDQAAEDAVRLQLKDPSSAQFEGITKKDTAVCGFVNAKNAMGGYVGFRAFIVKNGSAELDSEDGASGEFGKFATRFANECAEVTTRRYIDLLSGQANYYDKLTRP